MPYSSLRELMRQLYNLACKIPQPLRHIHLNFGSLASNYWSQVYINGGQQCDGLDSRVRHLLIQIRSRQEVATRFELRAYILQSLHARFVQPI
jgi:hypothetical protein